MLTLLKSPTFGVSMLIARNLASSAKISNVVVIGGGLMGSGVAQVAASTGHNVAVIDVDDALLKATKKRIETSLQRIAKKKFADNQANADKFLKNIMSNLQFLQGFEKANKALSETDVVVEAITEKLEVKQPLLKQLDKFVKKDCILVSNTSSLPIADIMQPVAHRKQYCGGLHFFNPVPMMKLVEVVSIPETSQATNKALTDFCKAMGKTPIQCKDTPGFVVNRLLVPYLIQSIQMYERGDATKEDIDIAMKLGAGYPMGPFELLDYVGLDTTKFISDFWAKRHPNDPILAARSKLLDKLVSEGKFGAKSGEGFFNHKKANKK